MKLAFSSKLFVISGSLLIGCAFWLMGAKPVAAISNQSPDNGSSTVNGNSATPWHAVGTGAFDGQTSYVKVYVMGNGGATVTITQNCNLDVGSPSVQFALDALDENESYQSLSAAPVGLLPASGTCANRTINIPATNGSGNPPAGGVFSAIRGHEAYRVFYLEATISPGPGDNERSYRVSVSGANNLVGISRVVKGSGRAAVFGIYQRDAPNLGSQTWNFNQPFAPRCGDANGAYGFGVFDADNGVYSPQNLNLTMARSARGAGNWAGFASWNGAQLGGNGEYNTFSFNADRDLIYRMQWSGINWHNTLQINVPFDEFDARLSLAQCNPPTNSVACNAANASVNPVNINQNSQFTVNIVNNGTVALDSSYSLRQTYWSSINATHQTLTRSLASGPGNLGPGRNGNFVFNISRAAPGTFTFEFQMQQNGALIGTFNPNCRIVLQVNDSTPTRPACYIHTTPVPPPAANLASASVPYGGGITLYPQIGNSTGKDWGSNYYVDEVNAAGASLRTLWPTGTVNATNDPNNAPYSAQHPVAYNNLTATTTFYYEVWIHAGALNGPTPFPNPPANFQGNRLLCSFTVYVEPPQVGGGIGPTAGLQANCKSISYEVHWTPAASNNIRTIIRTYSGGQHDQDRYLPPGTHSFDPFTDPAFATVPMDQPVTYELFAQTNPSDVNTFTDLGGVTIGPCMTSTCISASGIDIEPNETAGVTDVGGFSIDNQTNRNDPFTINTSVTGGSAVYANPYNFAGTSGPHKVPASSITAGTSTINISRSLNYRGAVINSCQESFTPGSRPYMKVFGADVSAGGWFNNGNTSCAGDINVQAGGGKGGIHTYAMANVGGHAYRSGSSSEFAAYALGSIDDTGGNRLGFYTKSQDKAATKFNPLDFANTPQNGQLGFSTGGVSTAYESCIKDYYSNITTSGATNIAGNLNAIPGNRADLNRIYNHGTTSFSIGGPAWQFNPGERLTIYVQGDVYINTNIKSSNSVVKPSYFTLIAKGNIYIGSNVTNIEGLYIAQPTGGNAGGNIWSCAVPGAGGVLQAPTGAETVANCRNKLVVNGAVVAKHMTLNRVGDLVTNTLSQVKSSDPETSTFTGGTNKAMEEFNYIPEMVSGSPLLSNIDSMSRYDSITVLPPLF